MSHFFDGAHNIAPAFRKWRLEQAVLAAHLRSGQPHHRSTARIAGQGIASPSTRRTHSARTGWLIAVRSMSLAASLDPVARACHPPAGAGLLASAPRTAGSTARRCAVVPHAARARGEHGVEVGRLAAFRQVGFPTALPRTGQATFAASGSPGRRGRVAGGSAPDGRRGTTPSCELDTPLALG